MSQGPTNEASASPAAAIHAIAPAACVLFVDAEGLLHGWSVEAVTLFGMSREAMEGKPLIALLPFLATHEHEGWCRRADGSMFRALVGTLSVARDEREHASAVQALVVTDVTSHYRRLERQVLDETEQLQRQIGQDLHDGLGQLLTGTAFLAKGLQRSVATADQPQVLRVVELINQAIGRVRSLARGLSPIHVEAQNLEEVLQHTVAESSELLGIQCELDMQDAVDSARPATIAQLCLIVREAITNAVRHGQARRVVVRLSREGDRSLLVVDDDGVGIGETDKSLDGLGLRNMRYRAQVIGGTLDVSRTSYGTTVRCLWSE